MDTNLTAQYPITKLAIAVVYAVAPDNEKLLDLHLEYIERHTGIPYTIYASADRLSPGLRYKLEQHPKVRICACDSTDVRGTKGHSFFLEQIVKAAIDDGASHVATFHVDSFPVRSGWAEELAGRLSNSCAIATLNCVDTGCLFFRREFYLNHHPRFLLTEAERASSRFKEYLRQFDPAVHAGIGYSYKAYCEGLEWY